MAVETAIAVAENVTRDFPAPSGVVQALRGVSLVVRTGKLIALRGRSGSGKTTLRNILTGLDNPTSGRVRIAGQDLAPLNETARALLRRRYVGVMFQNAHLFPILTAQENVEIPLRLGHGASPSERGERARRALVTSPRFLVADESTGNLDSQTGRAIAALLREVAHREGIAMLIATHDVTIAASADRVLQLHDGLLSGA